MTERQRAGLRAVPVQRPPWFKIARVYLSSAGLRRKDRAAYRGIGGRFLEHWPELAPAFERIAAGFHREREAGTWAWRPLGDRDDAGVLCALVFECFAWWAAEERESVAAVRDAERELLELQDNIDRAVDDLCAAVARVDELRLRHGLDVDAPMWADDLGEALAEVAHGFVRWGQEPDVEAMIEAERERLYSPRPGVLDIVRKARYVGVLRSDVAHQIRHPFTGEWLRRVAPEVGATDERSAEALRVRGGSGPKSDTAQLRLLFAGLQAVAKHNGARPGAPGPLQWLTAADLSTLCRVFVGGGPEALGLRRPWGTPAEEGFEPETARKERAAFTKSASDRKS